MEGQTEVLMPREGAKLIAETSKDVKVVDAGVDKIAQHVSHH
jgi:hypothetical protein